MKKRRGHKHKINHSTKKKKKKRERERKEQRNNRIIWKRSFEMLINTYLSIITLNVNGLNAPIKRHRGQTGEKSKSVQYAVYKRLILGQRTHIN